MKSFITFCLLFASTIAGAQSATDIQLQKMREGVFLSKCMLEYPDLENKIKSAANELVNKSKNRGDYHWGSRACRFVTEDNDITDGVTYIVVLGCPKGYTAVQTKCAPN